MTDLSCCYARPHHAIRPSAGGSSG